MILKVNTVVDHIARKIWRFFKCHICLADFSPAILSNVKGPRRNSVNSVRLFDCTTNAGIVSKNRHIITVFTRTT